VNIGDYRDEKNSRAGCGGSFRIAARGIRSISPAAAYPAATPAYPGAAAAYPAATAYPAASYPPQMPGAVTGSVAADRDGDGVIDGYYTSDGIYHPNMTPSLPPARLASRRGERG
jgi:hypothetical protein